MLITQLKAKEAITSLTAGKKVFIINCHGCKRGFIFREKRSC